MKGQIQDNTRRVMEKVNFIRKEWRYDLIQTRVYAMNKKSGINRNFVVESPHRGIRY